MSGGRLVVGCVIRLHLIALRIALRGLIARCLSLRLGLVRRSVIRVVAGDPLARGDCLSRGVDLGLLSLVSLLRLLRIGSRHLRLLLCLCRLGDRLLLRLLVRLPDCLLLKRLSLLLLLHRLLLHLRGLFRLLIGVCRLLSFLLLHPLGD